MAHLREQVRVVSGVNILVGVWLVLAPFALRFHQVEAAFWNSVIVGVVMAIVAMLRAFKPLRFQALSWASIVFGLWLLVSPFLLGFGTMIAPTLSHLLIGVIVTVLALWSALGARQASS